MGQKYLPMIVASGMIMIGVTAELYKIGAIYSSSLSEMQDILNETQKRLSFLGMSLPDTIAVRDVLLSEGNIYEYQKEVCNAVDDDTLALVSVSTCATLMLLEEVVAPLQLPLLGIHTDPCPHHNPSSTTFRVQPVTFSIHQAVVDLVISGQFSRVAILEDNAFIQASHLQSCLFNNLVQSSLVSISKTDTGSEQALAELLSAIQGRESGITCFLLLLEQEALDTIARAFVRSKIDLNDFHAILLPSVRPLTEDMLHGMSSFSDFLIVKQWHHIVNSSRWNDDDLELHTDVLETFQILRKAINYLGESKSTANVSTRRCGHTHVNISTSATALVGALYKIETNFTKFDENGINTFKQYSVGRLTFNNGTIASEDVAMWTSASGLHVHKGRELWKRSKHGLGNVTLRVGTNQAAPFMMKKDNGSGWEGFCVDILDELASRLNFRYELIQSPDVLWGTVNDEGEWNGVVEMVRSKDVDLGIGPISLNAERENVIDFTKPYMEEGAGIVLKRFEDKSSKIFRMFKPFSGNVWLTVAASVIVVGLSLAFVNHFSPIKDKQLERTGKDQHRVERTGKDQHRVERTGKDQHRVERTGKDRSAQWYGQERWPRRIRTSDNIWIVYESYMEQGSEVSPPNISGRFILGFWWIFTILMVASYKANLVAFLTVIFVGKPIKDIDDLAAQSVVKPLVKQGSNLYQELEKGNTETYRKLWSMMKTGPRVRTTEEALEYVLSGDYALLTDQSQVEFLMKSHCINLMLGESPFNVGGLGFIVPEGSYLLEILSFNIIKLQETGLTEKWRKHWWSSRGVCPADKASNVQSLELESTSGPFLVFAGSTVLALLCLAVEIVWAKLRLGKAACWCSCFGRIETRDTTSGGAVTDGKQPGESRGEREGITI